MTTLTQRLGDYAFRRFLDSPCDADLNPCLSGKLWLTLAEACMDQDDGVYFWRRVFAIWCTA